MGPKDDPTITRVREARHRISEQLAHDPEQVTAYYVELQEKYLHRLLPEAEAPLWTPYEALDASNTLINTLNEEQAPYEE